MSTFIITRNRVCAFSYKNEKDLPDGQKLLTCSRCKETHYVSREAQAQQWKHHKQVCRKAEDEELEDFDRWPWASLLDYVCFLLENPDRIKGREFLYLLQAVLGQLKGIHGSISEVGALMANRAVRALLDTLSGLNGKGPAAANEVVQKIWSIPGFCNYFLSDDILMPETMKEWKCKGLPPPGPQKYVDGVLDPSTAYDPFMQVNTVYCELVAALFYGTLRDHSEEEEPHVRINSALSVAAARQMSRTWCCPYSRASQPSFTKRSGFLSLMMDSSFTQAHSPARKFMTEQEVFPGMDMKQILQVLMDDERFFRDPSGRGGRYILETLCRYCASIHYKEHLTPLDRIELLDKFFDWDVPDKSFQPDDGMAGQTGIRQVMYMLCTSFSTNTFLKICAEILDPSTPDPKNVMTADSLAKKYQERMDEVMPLVQLYVDLVEPAYSVAQRPPRMTLHFPSPRN